jgi:hypothetical protein
MTRLFNSCRKYRENLCAMTSSDLPPEDRVRLERHLASCADCRQYRDDIGSMTALLTAGGELFPDVEPSESTCMRWATDFEAAIEPGCSTVTRALRGFLDWSRDMVWPCRRIWAGIAAIWLVILGLSATQRAKNEAQGYPSPEIMRALLAREGFLPGASRTAEGGSVEPTGQSPPQPRSEQRDHLEKSV